MYTTPNQPDNRLPYAGTPYPPTVQPPSYQPYYSPYTPPMTPQQAEKKRLRGDAAYIGGMMLALTATMQLFFTVVVLLLQAFGVITAEALYYDDFLGLGNTAYMLVYACVYAFDFIAPTVLVALCCKRRHFPLGPAGKVAASDAFLGVLAAMGGCILANFAANYMSAFLEQFGITRPEMPQLLENTPQSLLINLIVIAVLPALLEEMVFRGYVLRAFRPYGDWFAVAVSSLLFGLMHGNILQIPFALIVGFLLGWLYVMTDNIWLPVAVHFCNNAMSTLMEYISLDMPPETQSLYILLCFGLIAVIGAVAMLILVVRRSDLLRRLPKRSVLSVGQRTGALLTSPLFLIAVIVFLILTALGA